MTKIVKLKGRPSQTAYTGELNEQSHDQVLQGSAVTQTVLGVQPVKPLVAQFLCTRLLKSTRVSSRKSCNNKIRHSFWTQEGSLMATTVVLVVTVFKKCLRLC